MADFDVNTITAQGAIAIASATAGDKLVIDGCDATTQVLTKAQAVQIGTRPVSPASTTTSIALAGSTDNHVYAYASFIKGETGQPGGDVHSFFLYGHMESTPNSIVVIAIASATDDIHLPTSSDVTNRTEIQFELTFSATDEVVTVADTSMYTTRGEFLLLKNRTVTTHAEGDPTRGDNQNILGAKTFVDKICADYIDLPADSQSNGVQVNANIVPTEDNVYGLGADLAWSGVRAWEIHTTSIENGLDAPGSPIGVYASLTPYGNISLGDSSHAWQYIYANTANVGNVRYDNLLNATSYCERTEGDDYARVSLETSAPDDPCVNIFLESNTANDSASFGFCLAYFAAPGKDLGYANGGEWNNIYAKGISLPSLTVTPNVMPDTDVPLGCVLLVYLYIGAHAQNVYHAPGTEWNSNGNNMAVGVLTESGFQRMTDYNKIKSGYKFVLLSGAFSAGGSTSLDGTYVPAFVMRIK